MSEIGQIVVDRVDWIFMTRSGISVFCSDNRWTWSDFGLSKKSIIRIVSWNQFVSYPLRYWLTCIGVTEITLISGTSNKILSLFKICSSNKHRTSQSLRWSNLHPLTGKSTHDTIDSMFVTLYEPIRLVHPPVKHFFGNKIILRDTKQL